VPAILASILALGISYLVVRTALAALNPLAAQLPPAEHSRLLRLRIFEVLLPGRPLPADLVALARQTARSEPLAFEPFVIAALVAERRGQLAEAIRLMEEARRRRRSFVPTRLQLSGYYMRTGRFEEGLRELEVILSLRQDMIQPVMVELAKLIPLAEGRRLLADVLVRNPSWRTPFYAVARGAGVTPEQARALIDQMRARRPNADLRQEEQLYMTALVDAGQIRSAREIWLRALPQQEQSRHALLANPGFAGRRVAGPFGWTLNAVDVGRAEIRSEGSPNAYLYVDFFGGSNAVLAEQLLALPPGAYTLRFQAAGEGSSGSSRIAWTMACHPGSRQLLRLDVANVGEAFRPMQSSFTVPAGGCDGQRLSLAGEAGDMPSTVTLRIRGLEIVR